jgi:hypothetical protein
LNEKDSSRRSYSSECKLIKVFLKARRAVIALRSSTLSGRRREESRLTGNLLIGASRDPKSALRRNKVGIRGDHV